MTNDLGLEVRDEGPDCVLQMGRRRLCGKSQYCDARVVGRSVPQGIPEIEIEGNQTPLLLTRGLDDSIVRGSGKDVGSGLKKDVGSGLNIGY